MGDSTQTNQINCSCRLQTLQYQFQQKKSSIRRVCLADNSKRISIHNLSTSSARCNNTLRDIISSVRATIANRVNTCKTGGRGATATSATSTMPTTAVEILKQAYLYRQDGFQSERFTELYLDWCKATNYADTDGENFRVYVKVHGEPARTRSASFVSSNTELVTLRRCSRRTIKLL